MEWLVVEIDTILFYESFWYKRRFNEILEKNSLILRNISYIFAFCSKLYTEKKLLFIQYIVYIYMWYLLEIWEILK